MILYEPCQRKHHRWYEGTDPNWTPAFGLIGEVELCDNCGTVRRRGIDALGRVATVQYIYPPGYSMGRDERPSKEQLRAEWYEREMRKRKLKKPAKKAAARKLRSVS